MKCFLKVLYMTRALCADWYGGLQLWKTVLYSVYHTFQWRQSLWSSVNTTQIVWLAL